MTTLTHDAGAGLMTSSMVVARRGLLRFWRTPQLVVLGTVQGAMFLLIFRYVFGGAIDIGAMSYVDFLVPGFITTAVLFAGMGTATAVAEDLEQGFVDRVRSLPIPRSSFLTGRVASDTVLCAWSLATTAAVGFAVGFRPHGDLGGLLAAFGLLVVCGFAFTWLFVLLGLLAGSAQAAQGMAFLVFPLTFVSSAYVPVETLPSWLQAFANHQPLTVMIDATRALVHGPAVEAFVGAQAGALVGRSLLWCAAITVVCAPLAALVFRRN